MKILEEALKRLDEFEVEECFNCEYFLLEENIPPCNTCVDEAHWVAWHKLETFRAQL